MSGMALLLLLLGTPPAGLEGSLDGLVYVCPGAGSDWQSTGTVLILGFEGAVPEGLSVEVAGTASGAVACSEYVSGDGARLVLTPSQPFEYGEYVTVSVHAPGRGTAEWSFGVRPEDPPALLPDLAEQDAHLPEETVPGPPEASTAPGSVNSVTLPADFPAITFETSGSTAPGNLFFGPMNMSGSNNSTYFVIADNSGQVLSYRHAHSIFYDIEVQSDGCLSFISGSLSGDDNQWMVLDDSYSKVDSFAVIGYDTDIHAFTVAQNGNLLLIGLDRRYVDMSQVVPGGNPDALVTGLLIQEQDRNHMPVFQWSSFDHFEITDACDYVNLTGAYVDYVHCNSITEDSDGGLLFSCNAMTECTKIDRNTGDIVWRFGGYLSDNPDFDILNDPLGGFSAQHDFRHVSGNLYSVFDNGCHHSPLISRACIYELDTQGMTADLVWSFQITGLYGSHMGSTQSLPNGNILVGWGDVTGYQPRPDISEVTPSGTIVFSGRLNQLSMESYRSYRFDWIGQALVPYLVALVLPAQNCVQLTYNVFGDVEYSSYDIYQGTSPGSLLFLQNTPLRQINLWSLPTGMNYFAVKARDMQGIPTGFSNVDSAMVTWTGIEEDHAALQDGSARVGVFPNPAESGFTAVWPCVPGEDAVVEILDCAGRVAGHGTLEARFSDRASLAMDTGDLPAGLYLVSVRAGGFSGTARLVILH